MASSRTRDQLGGRIREVSVGRYVISALKKARLWLNGLPQRIFASVQASLERLQLDYIDVLQCHRFDYDTPIEETMQALHDLVQAGLVRYIGMSSCWAWQFQLMQSELCFCLALSFLRPQDRQLPVQSVLANRLELIMNTQHTP